MKRAQIVLGLTVLTVGILSVVPAIRATRISAASMQTRHAMGDPFAPDARVSLRLPLQGSEDLTYGAVTESPGGEESASELNRKLTNPVSSIWSIRISSTTSS